MYCTCRLLKHSLCVSMSTQLSHINPTLYKESFNVRNLHTSDETHQSTEIQLFNIFFRNGNLEMYALMQLINQNFQKRKLINTKARRHLCSDTNKQQSTEFFTEFKLVRTKMVNNTRCLLFLQHNINNNSKFTQRNFMQHLNSA